ncbi:hypothetical protein TELCIR_20494 [Teladorsagia circumcincta]|uniref:Peptidase M12A domain-containing protein n=1 Tax=Teladorsagia circumcincta TaxID=45464 RepID=A0A2G9TL47_TELCI|nr:hypothetical protein TELCIR_20494 [Teladorsagia circumcincta]
MVPLTKSVGRPESLTRKPVQKVYFWPSLTAPEREILRDAFFQIGRRTCIKFLEQEYKPWFHADRWESNQPYVLIRKSRKYADNRSALKDLCTEQL